jgi:type II secretory pathway component PulM
MDELLARLGAVWDNLLPREQTLVSVAAGMFAASLVVFAVVMPILNLADRTHSRVDNANQQILAMTRLTREYAEIASRLDGVEQRIEGQSGERNIRTLLEILAMSSAVKIDSMEERQAGKNNQYAESKVEVSLKNVSLGQVIKYLHNIESAHRQLSVKSLRIRGRQDKSQLLDVSFAVSSFEPV